MSKFVPRYQMSGIWGQIAFLGNESNCWGKVLLVGWASLLGRGGR